MRNPEVSFAISFFRLILRMSSMRLTAKPFSATRPANASRRCVRVSAAMKLYSNPASRGRIIEWYVREIGKDSEVEVINMDMKEKREHKSDWFKKVGEHPNSTLDAHPCLCTLVSPTPVNRGASNPPSASR